MSERKELAARLRTLAAGEPADSLFLRAADLLDPPAQGPTVRIRVAVAVTRDGTWDTAGRKEQSDADSVGYAQEGVWREADEAFPARVCWIEADVPAWEPPPTVEGEVA